MTVNRRWRAVLSVVFACAGAATGQRAGDTLLFQVALGDDSTGLMRCAWGGDALGTLSGPVMMEKQRLLFYSRYGYVLFDQAGTVVDSHSVFSLNAQPSPDDPSRFMLAQPIDMSTLLYTSAPSDGQGLVRLWQKKLSRHRMKEIKDERARMFRPAVEARLINIAHNVITDEMGVSACLEPNLVGWHARDKRDVRWWSLDKFYSFSSPLIHERQGTYSSFFPGARPTLDAPREVKTQLVEPLATFVRGGRRFYVGVHATMGTSSDEYFQHLYFCDEAGNILCADTLLKQATADVILGEDVKGKMVYTARQTSRYVFQPAVSDNGTVFYGVFDYQTKTVSVHRRTYFTYRARPAEPCCAHLIDVERNITYAPLGLACKSGGQEGASIPDVQFVDEKGRRRKAIPRDLTTDDFLVRILRQQNRDIASKLARRRLPVPAWVNAIRDSLSRVETAACPYAVSLSGPKGMLRTFGYPLGQRVLCARVLARTGAGQVVIRVDLENYAEILLFDGDGGFINRFTFNSGTYQARKDIVVAGGHNRIIELDYESGNSGGKFLEWTPVVN